MAADVSATLKAVASFVMNRLQLRKRINPMQLFPARVHLVSESVDSLGPLPKSKSGRRFLLVITERLAKITKAVSF